MLCKHSGERASPNLNTQLLAFVDRLSYFLIHGCPSLVNFLGDGLYFLVDRLLWLSGKPS